MKIEVRELASLTDTNFYRVFDAKKGAKTREVQEPIHLRKKIHFRLQQLMMKIQTPEYLFSGKKGVSSIDNAKYHVSNSYMLATDIESFYTNCKKEHVFRLFRYQFKMSDDVAWLLANLTCYSDHIPTGSHLSQTLAYWTHSNLFNKISKEAKDRQMLFSLYVDDMTFSTNNPISKDFHLLIDNKLKRAGLNIKKKKTKYFSKKKYKTVTGPIIGPEKELLIPNKHYYEIMKMVGKHKQSGSITQKDTQRLLGKIGYVRQILPNKFEQLNCYYKVLYKKKLKDKKTIKPNTILNKDLNWFEQEHALLN